LNHFNEVTGVKRISSVIKKAEKEDLLKNYVISQFGENFDHIAEVAYCLCTIVAPKAISLGMLGFRKTKENINRIHNTLYKFSISKVEKLTKDLGSCFLLDKFLSIEENIDKLMEGPKISADSYRQAIEQLKSRIERTIDSSI
jgi:hypothetical protein